MATKKRILIVDDDPGIGSVLRIQLSMSGYDVGSTTSGAEAVELIRKQTPDCVLLDALMPDMNGAEVLKQVRAFSKVPVIIFTGHTDLGRDALKLGANDYITKPFEHDLLLEKLTAVMSTPMPKPKRGRRD